MKECFVLSNLPV